MVVLYVAAVVAAVLFLFWKLGELIDYCMAWRRNVS